MRLSTNQNPTVRTGKSYDLVLLLLWTVLGCWLRFLNLTGKPPWTDEFATMVFSLGNDYHSVLLDQLISPENLLQPLRINPDASIFDVISLLLNNDNHPPVYFVLAHWWMGLFPTDGEYVSIWAARSLPALLGGLSIPAVYYLSKIAFPCRIVAQLSALMMAVSPYGVFIAQEARHYTLAILLVLFSLCCLLKSVKQFENQAIISIRLVFVWIIINCFGLAVHYFFSLTLAAEAIILVIFCFYQFKNPVVFSSKPGLEILRLQKNYWRLGLVALGTITAGIVWIVYLIPYDYGNGMTQWIRQDNFNFITLISPVFQLSAAWVTMIALLPIESSFFPLVIVSGLLMLFFFIWAIPKLYWALKFRAKQADFSLGIKVLLGFVISAIALFFAFTYLLGIDITRGARYSFVYFPAVPVLLGVILAVFWQQSEISYCPQSHPHFKKSKWVIFIITFMGFLSALTITFDLGYQKYYSPNQLIKVIENTANNPVLLVTTHQSLVQIGEMMGIAWELSKYSLPIDVRFLLAHNDLNNPEIATVTLKNILTELNRPLEIWAVNFKASVELNHCQVDLRSFPNVSGYKYQRYECF